MTLEVRLRLLQNDMYIGARLTMSSTAASARSVAAHNNLLEVMPPDVRAAVAPWLELVPLKLGEVLYESGVVQQHVYFLTDCIVSLLYVLENGQSAEIAVGSPPVRVMNT